MFPIRKVSQMKDSLRKESQKNETLRRELVATSDQISDLRSVTDKLNLIYVLHSDQCYIFDYFDV